MCWAINYPIDGIEDREFPSLKDIKLKEGEPSKGRYYCPPLIKTGAKKMVTLSQR